MKVLIWIGCSLIPAIIIALCAATGFTLGALPTMLLYIPMFSLAKSLCKKYDEKYGEKNRLKKEAAARARKEKREAAAKAREEKTIVKTESAQQDDLPATILFCNKCGQRLRPNSAFCSYCGASIPSNTGSSANKLAEPSRMAAGQQIGKDHLGTQSKKKKIGILILLSGIILLLITALCLWLFVFRVPPACAKDPLKGTWYVEDRGNKVEFNDDGLYLIYQPGGDVDAYQYHILDDNRVYISLGRTFSYRFSKGKLILSSGKGKDLVLVKKKP